MPRVVPGSGCGAARGAGVRAPGSPFGRCARSGPAPRSPRNSPPPRPACQRVGVALARTLGAGDARAPPFALRSRFLQAGGRWGGPGAARPAVGTRDPRGRRPWLHPRLPPSGGASPRQPRAGEGRPRPRLEDARRRGPETRAPGRLARPPSAPGAAPTPESGRGRRPWRRLASPPPAGHRQLAGPGCSRGRSGWRAGCLGFAPSSCGGWRPGVGRRRTRWGESCRCAEETLSRSSSVPLATQRDCRLDLRRSITLPGYPPRVGLEDGTQRAAGRQRRAVFCAPLPRQAESNRAGMRPLGGWSLSRFGVSYAIISTAINAVVIGTDARKDFVFRLL